MEAINIRMLSDATNAVVLQLPGRKYPGIVIQGDSLAILYMLVKEMRRNLDNETDDNSHLLDELTDLIGGYLKEYESALKRHNVEMPYNGPLLPE